MNPIDAYLTELRSALGDRLPPGVHTARLRETQAHLLASADDVGEDEAIRRYGHPRAVANGLVRAHRYDEKSAWSLVLPVATGFVLTGLLASILARGTFAAESLYDDLARAAMLCSVPAFALRAAQTRRWIAGPMAAVHAVAGVVVLTLNHLAHPTSWTVGDTLMLTLYIALYAVAWTVVNALAIATASLLDYRRVRNSR